MRPPFGVFLAFALASLGCTSVCDEVAEEAEAGGCAVGVLPVDTEAENEDLKTCEGEREARAQCLLDLTDNLCAITEEEAVTLAACYEAAQGIGTDP